MPADTSSQGWNDPTATPSQSVNQVVFTTGSKRVINASADVVFSVITDFSKYNEWNTWTPSLQFDQDDRDIGAGSKGKLKARMVDQDREYDIPIEILELNRTSGLHRLVWQSQMLPRWVFCAERVQEVRPLDGSSTQSEVIQWESMSGPMAYVFKYVMGVPEQLGGVNLNYLEEVARRAESCTGHDTVDDNEDS